MGIMDFVNEIYNYRPLALLLITIENLIDHFQIIGLLKFAYNSKESSWTPKARYFVNWFFENFLFQTENNNHKTYYVVSVIIVSLTVILYCLFLDQIHKYNARKMSVVLAVILVIDHLIYGPGALAMARVLNSNKFCTEYKEMMYDSSVTCWETAHLNLIWFGYLFSGFVLTLTCGIGPILRAERCGAEKQFGNDALCPGIYKLYLFACLYVLTEIKEPYMGIIGGVPVICYLLYFEGYEESHICKIKISSICGIVWGFICCYKLTDDQTAGSDMLLIGWGLSLSAGYSLLSIKHLLSPRRNPSELPIDKQPN